MIVLLKNGKRVWLDNLTDRETKSEITGVILSEIIPNRNFAISFFWEDVSEVLCVGIKDIRFS